MCCKHLEWGKKEAGNSEKSKMRNERVHNNMMSQTIVVSNKNLLHLCIWKGVGVGVCL